MNPLYVIFAGIPVVVALFVGGIWAYSEFQVGAALFSGFSPVVVESAKNAVPNVPAVVTGLSVAADAKETVDAFKKNPAEGTGKLFGVLDIQPFSLVLLAIFLAACWGAWGTFVS